MNFQISGLAARPFESLFALSDEQLRAHDARRLVVDEDPGYPCRVSLQDAGIGERSS